MKRCERRRLKREAEKLNAEQLAANKVTTVVEDLLNQFYTTMRENKISKERASIILNETAKRVSNPEAIKISGQVVEK